MVKSGSSLVVKNNTRPIMGGFFFYILAVRGRFGISQKNLEIKKKKKTKRATDGSSGGNGPAVFVECQHVTPVVDTRHAVDVSVFGREQLVGHVLLLPSLFRVLRPVVPQQRHHHFTCDQTKTDVIELSKTGNGGMSEDKNALFENRWRC